MRAYRPVLNAFCGCVVVSALLVTACLLVGMLPGTTVGPFLRTAAESVIGPTMPSAFAT